MLGAAEPVGRDHCACAPGAQEPQAPVPWSWLLCRKKAAATEAGVLAAGEWALATARAAGSKAPV